MRYLILEQCRYDSTPVSFLPVPSDFPLRDDEMVTLLNIHEAYEYACVGEIRGELDTTLPIIDFLRETAEQINTLFLCSQGSPHTSVLDRFYSWKECFAIACSNDSPTFPFWQPSMDDRYAHYQQGYSLYQKAKTYYDANKKTATTGS